MIIGVKDFILNVKKWKRIDVMLRPDDSSSNWLSEQVKIYSKKTRSKLVVSTTLQVFEKEISSSVD